ASPAAPRVEKGHRRLASVEREPFRRAGAAAARLPVPEAPWMATERRGKASPSFDILKTGLRHDIEAHLLARDVVRDVLGGHANEIAACRQAVWNRQRADARAGARVPSQFNWRRAVEARHDRA